MEEEDFGATLGWRDIEVEEPQPPKPVDPNNLNDLLGWEVPKETISANDLTKPEHMAVIRDYMYERFGVDEYRDVSDDELANDYLNNMRGYSAGNLVRAGNELAWLNNISDDEGKMATAGAAYKLFEDMENLYTGDTTLGERIGGTGDYLRTSIFDLSNLVSFGVGKVAVGAGSKAATKLAQKAAMSAFTKKMAKGATAAVAKKTADKIFAKTIQKAATTTVKRSAVKEVAAAAVTDSALAIGTDYAFQEGMIRTGNQEEFSKVQSGLSALGGLIGGAIQLGSIAVRGTSGLAMPKEVFTPANNFGVIDPLKSTLKKVVERGNWKDRVAKGKELKDLDTDFFIKLLLGEDGDDGFEGLAHILSKEGYIWKPEMQDDRLSYWMADILAKVPEKQGKEFIKEIETGLGITVKDLKNGVKVGGMEAFANIFAKKISQQGQVLNSLSQVAKILGKPVEALTNADVAMTNLGHSLARGLGNVTPTGVEKFAKELSKRGATVQNNIIKLMVSSPATTAPNIIGYTANALVNVTSDLGLALIHSPKAALELLLLGSGDSTSAVKAITGALWQRAKNTIDPDTTYDAFMSYANLRPAQMSQITSVINGGVENVGKTIKDMGFNPDELIIGGARVGAISQDVVDFFGKWSGMDAQDVYTKSQEFVYQLDKSLRLNFNQGWSQFMADPNVAKNMASLAYKQAESKAVYETLRSISSKSFKGSGVIGELAGLLEDVRKIPAIGLTLPFGKFFNNTIAIMSDSAGLSLIGKAIGLNKERSGLELFARAAVGWGVVASMVPREMEYQKANLKWDERLDPQTGAVISDEYNFPISAHKAMARLIAIHRMEGEEASATLAEQIGANLMGQLTRQLQETGDGFYELLKNTLTNPADFLPNTAEAMGKIVSKIGSAATRPLDVVNSSVGVLRGADFSVMDRRQGNKIINDSIRYMDQIIALATGDIQEERHMAATGTQEALPSKFVGVRENIAQTNVEKMMNRIGAPSWKLSSYTGAPEADNAYNRLFFKNADRMARLLINQPKWNNGAWNTETRKSKVDALLKEAKDMTVGVMKLKTSGTKEDSFGRMVEIGEANSKTAIAKALKEMEIELGEDMPEFDDLNSFQLDMLESYLDFHSKVLELR